MQLSCRYMFWELTKIWRMNEADIAFIIECWSFITIFIYHVTGVIISFSNMNHAQTVLESCFSRKRKLRDDYEQVHFPIVMHHSIDDCYILQFDLIRSYTRFKICILWNIFYWEIALYYIDIIRYKLDNNRQSGMSYRHDVYIHCIYVCLYVCLYVYMHIRMYACMRTCACTWGYGPWLSCQYSTLH